jgi:hypothetical protein
MFRKVVIFMIFLLLSVGQVMPAFAQVDDGVYPDDPPSGVVEDSAAPAVEKGTYTPGEANSIDAGNAFMYLPFASTQNGAEANAAAPAASWVNIIYDEFCSYPNGWYNYDYGGTGHTWAYATVDGWCTGRPNGYVNKMSVVTYRYIDLTGALNARVRFRFKMTTESYYDFFRFEYSCNGGKTLWSVSYSGVYDWTTPEITMTRCKGFNNVQLRFMFQSDQIVTSTAPPALDYVIVDKFW